MQKENCTYYAGASQWIGKDLPAPIIVLGDTGSVLDDAWSLVQAGHLPVWGSVIARSQSNGRGQTRRVWQSPLGNMYVALRLPNSAPFDSTAAAPAISALIIQALEQIGINIKLKWPNDLVLNLQKVGGILLEEKQGITIAGIGINIVDAPANNLMREGTAFEAGILAMSDSTKNQLTLENNSDLFSDIYLAELLWLCLVRRIYFCYRSVLPTPWPNVWREVAESYLLWKGKIVSIGDENNLTNGILTGLGNDGELVLMVNGHEKYFLSGSLNLGA